MEDKYAYKHYPHPSKLGAKEMTVRQLAKFWSARTTKSVDEANKDLHSLYSLMEDVLLEGHSIRIPCVGLIYSRYDRNGVDRKVRFKGSRQMNKKLTATPID